MLWRILITLGQSKLFSWRIIFVFIQVLFCWSWSPIMILFIWRMSMFRAISAFLLVTTFRRFRMTGRSRSITSFFFVTIMMKCMLFTSTTIAPLYFFIRWKIILVLFFSFARLMFFIIVLATSFILAARFACFCCSSFWCCGSLKFLRAMISLKYLKYGDILN